MAMAHRMAALGLIALCNVAAARPGDAPVVQALAGAVRGTENDGEHIFKGIPYAMPPVGARRWTAPQPLPAWSGVRDASQFGAACMQIPYPFGSTYAETYPAMSEDCLTLNVWEPRNAKNAPVFFWIHGGSLLRGSSQETIFDGAQMAKRGIVVVSINYRLGVLGFLAHPELSAESPQGVSGNYALLDQIEALRWVKRNIGAFGGDPAKVTIAGESAGGLSILYLLASPMARGLFSKAIAQSAYMISTPELKRDAYGEYSAEGAGVKFATAVGAKGIADLRSMDSAAIIAAAQKGNFAPSGTIDGQVLTRQLVDTFDRGEQARVPVLTGFNAGEIRSLRQLLMKPPADAAQYEAMIRERYGDAADAFLRAYPSTNIEESMLAAVRDGLFGWTSERLVRSQAKLGLPAYLYFFDHGYRAEEDAHLHGFHESEVPYLFGNIENTPVHWPKVPDTKVQWSLSAAMTDYWASFARDAKPVAPGQPDWHPFNQGNAYMHFTDVPHAETNLFPGRFELHEHMVCRRHTTGTIAWNWNVGVALPSLPPQTEACR